MDQCYSVELRFKLRDDRGSEENLRRVMCQWMEDMTAEYPKGLRVNWALDEHAKDGYTTDTLDGICKILLSFRQGDGYTHVDDSGFFVYSSGFHASYGWVSVMVEAFKRMSFALVEGSELYINDDEGTERHRVYQEMAEDVFAKDDYDKMALARVEKIGVDVYEVNGKYLEYWSYFGTEGFYFVRHDLDSGKDVLRKQCIPDGMVPRFLCDGELRPKYNYMKG